MTARPTRDDAWALLCDWTQGEALRKHGLAVDAIDRWIYDLGDDEADLRAQLREAKEQLEASPSR